MTPIIVKQLGFRYHAYVTSRCLSHTATLVVGPGIGNVIDVTCFGIYDTVFIQTYFLW